MTADPISSREHILISNIIQHNWKQRQDADIASLIRSIQTPPFERVGAFATDSFFPAKERYELALKLNNLLAAPGFGTWLEGEPLYVARFLHTPEGRPRISIFSIAHLSDAEWMFFVTLLLIRWWPGCGRSRERRVCALWFIWMRWLDTSSGRRSAIE